VAGLSHGCFLRSLPLAPTAHLPTPDPDVVSYGNGLAFGAI